MMVPSQRDAYKYALSMELRKDGFRFAFLSAESKEVVFYKSVNFDGFDEESLMELLSEPYFKYTFSSVSLSVSTNRMTLVPEAIFNNTTPKAIFELNHTNPIDNLDYSRLPELGLVTIYEIPLWIKSIFVKQFLRIKIVHHSTVILKGVFGQPTYKAKAHIYKEKELFYLILTDKNKLNYFNLFESSEIADLIYYYLFVLEQKEINSKDMPLTVYGLESDHPAISEMNKLLADPIRMYYKEEEENKFILINQLLCV
ncbi:hypothetical protein DNU06_07815 [Putridiphycobacter roseus]|uniref:DUF3822 domain-containing protein n=1 Tax=Putridiphycobacter roseus TaxID=2219161 RepID=A0A2W1N0I6_9FLAO|nr:DUF3822 family protein [Putridiphycobacter roseus]PZE17727.1 hypothetical protein DNU06_07815 [Putridiphycobacter roseus]